MAVSFHLQLMTPEGVLFDGQVQAVILPGHDGYFGVLANHAPLVAELGIGEVVVTPADGQRRYFAITGGIGEVGENTVAVLADGGEAGEDIDAGRAKAAAERARHRLGGEGPEPDIDVQRAQLALARALNRLHVVSEVSS